jgi:hypothetical protein
MIPRVKTSLLTEGHQKIKISTDFLGICKPDENAKRSAERTFSQPNRTGESQHTPSMEMVVRKENGNRILKQESEFTRANNLLISYISFV